VEQGGCQVAAHTLAKAELAHRGIEEALELHGLHELVARLPVLRGWQAIDLSQQVEGLDDRQVPPELRALAKDDANLSHMGDAVLPGYPAEDLGHPTRRHQDP